MQCEHVLAIDSGNVQSAYVLMELDTYKPLEQGILPNVDMLALNVVYGGTTELAIEMVASYGMPVGETVFDTVFWIGRFYQQHGSYNPRQRIYRKDVKMNLCHSMRAKDSNIRQALIDRFGTVGTKKEPGWFYGFKKDIWAAYAVGVTYIDMKKSGAIA